MQRKIVNRYFKRLVKALNSCEITLRKNPKVGKREVLGWYRDSKIVIADQPKTSNMVLTLLHEALHHAYPGIPELDSQDEEVDLLSRELYCSFSTDQIHTLEKYLK